MITTLLFVTVVLAIIGWWLSRQRLTAKPWLEAGPIEAFPWTEASPMPPAKLGLRIFMTVVGCLFALLISAYVMRASSGDWQALPVSDLLWFNTAVLIASSLSLYGAQVATNRNQLDTLKIAMSLGAAFALIFLLGQFLLWRQLTSAGYFLARNPANAFFYLLIALHGLHLCGGLAALGKVGRKVWRARETAQLRLSVELCATYWHFLLLLWLVLLALLTHSIEQVVAICGRFFA